MSAPAPWQKEFIERVGALAEPNGLPPSFARVFAWMIVCDPPHQSVDQMRETLGLSSGAISMATATLVRMGVAERITLPGERRKYLRFHPNAWERMLRLRVEGAAQMRLIADEAIAAAPRRRAPDRLLEMRDVYGWFETLVSDLLVDTPWINSRSGRNSGVASPKP